MNSPDRGWKCEPGIPGKMKVYFRIIPPPGEPPHDRIRWHLYAEITFYFSKGDAIQFVVERPIWKYKSLLTFEPQEEKRGLVRIEDPQRLVMEGIKRATAEYFMRYEEMEICEFVIGYINRKNMTVTEPQGWWEISDGVETEFSSLCVTDGWDYESDDRLSD